MSMNYNCRLHWILFWDSIVIHRRPRTDLAKRIYYPVLNSIIQHHFSCRIIIQVQVNRVKIEFKWSLSADSANYLFSVP
jgi:hypothetical protein